MITGKTIAITRSKEDSEEFIQLITNAKARPISLPTIELVSKGEKIVDEFLNTIKKENPDFSVFMSSKAVKLLFETARKVSKYEKLQRSEEHTSELQSHVNLVCRLLLEKKKDILNFIILYINFKNICHL